MNFSLAELAGRNKIEILIVLALFFFAFGVRILPSDKGHLLNGIDEFWNARMIKYVITQEHPGWPFVPFADSGTDYPYGRPLATGAAMGWFLPNAITYWIVGGGAAFNPTLLMTVMSWVVAFFGSLAIPLVYLFGKAAYSRLVGLSAALFLAVSQAHLSYSIFGRAENDGLGFSLFFLVLLAFVWMVKSPSWKRAVFLTLAFMWASLTWQSYEVAAVLLAGTVLVSFFCYAVFSQVGSYVPDESNRRKRQGLIYALLCIFFAIWPLYFIAGGGGVEVSLVGFVCLVCGLIEARLQKTDLGRGFREIKQLGWKFWSPMESREGQVVRVVAVAVAILAVGWLLYGFNLISQPLGVLGISISKSTATVPDYEARMVTTIAEQQKTGGNSFIDRLYNTTDQFGLGIPTTFALAAVFILFGKIFIFPFIRRDFNYEWDVLALGYVLFGMIFLTGEALTLFFLSGVIAFGAGYFFGSLVSLVRVFSKQLGKHVQYVGYAKLAVLFVVLGFFFSNLPNAISSSENSGYLVPNEWFQTFDFINANLPKGSVLTTWWDYGHWLNFFTGDKTFQSLDNIQDRKDIIYTVARSFTHTTNAKCRADVRDMNCDSTQEALDRAEVEALSLLKPLKTTHIIIDKEIIMGKSGALQTISANYIGGVQAFPCVSDEQGTVGCLIQEVQQGGQRFQVGVAFSSQEWGLIFNNSWPGMVISRQLFVFGGGMINQSTTFRAFARKDSQATWLYAIQPESPAVYSFKARMFFSDTSLKHVKKVFDNGWNVIYAVNFTDIPDAKNCGEIGAETQTCNLLPPA